MSALQHAVKVMARESFESIAHDCEKLSPFLLHMLYKALLACFRMKQIPPAGIDIAFNIHALKKALERFKSRWLVAGMLEIKYPLKHEMYEKDCLHDARYLSFACKETGSFLPYTISITVIIIYY